MALVRAGSPGDADVPVDVVPLEPASRSRNSWLKGSIPATPSWRWRLVRMYPKRVMRPGYVLSAPAATRKYHPSGVRNNRGFPPLRWAGEMVRGKQHKRLRINFRTGASSIVVRFR